MCRAAPRSRIAWPTARSSPERRSACATRSNGRWVARSELPAHLSVPGHDDARGGAALAGSVRERSDAKARATLIGVLFNAVGTALWLFAPDCAILGPDDAKRSRP